MKTPFDYEKPELFDFNTGSARGADDSCYAVEAESTCPGMDDDIQN